MAGRPRSSQELAAKKIKTKGIKKIECFFSNVIYREILTYLTQQLQIANVLVTSPWQKYPAFNKQDRKMQLAINIKIGRS